MAEYDNLESIVVGVEAGRGVAIIYEGVAGIAGKRLVLRPLKPAPTSTVHDRLP
jgi:hypothetical protein